MNGVARYNAAYRQMGELYGGLEDANDLQIQISTLERKAGESASDTYIRLSNLHTAYAAACATENIPPITWDNPAVTRAYVVACEMEEVLASLLASRPTMDVTHTAVLRCEVARNNRRARDRVRAGKSMVMPARVETEPPPWALTLLANFQPRGRERPTRSRSPQGREGRTAQGHSPPRYAERNQQRPRIQPAPANDQCGICGGRNGVHAEGCPHAPVTPTCFKCGGPHWAVNCQHVRASAVILNTRPAAGLPVRATRPTRPPAGNNLCKWATSPGGCKFISSCRKIHTHTIDAPRNVCRHWFFENRCDRQNCRFDHAI